MKKSLLLFAFLQCFFGSLFSATFTVTSNLDNGAGTLRAALTNAAATAGGPHQIVFASAMTIVLNTGLVIGNNANLTGLAVNGFVDNVAGPDVIIRSSANFTNTGLEVASANNIKIYGIVFQNLEYGIRFHDNCTGGEVKGCYFGSNKAGTAIQDGIQKSGIFLQNNCTGILIGGTSTISGSPEGNLFVGCMRVYTGTNNGADLGKYGALQFDNACNNNTIAGNTFGTDINGNANLGNGQQADRELPLGHHNIFINFSTGNTIDRNLISGATGVGIYIQGGSNGTIITGNKVGTNRGATAQIPNKACGIYIESSDNIVLGYNGGDIAQQRNIISGNGGALHNNYDDNCPFGWNDFNQYGIFCKNTNNSTFKGNYIGTDITGLNNGTNSTVGNRAGGLKIVGQAKNNMIGGSTDNERNVISGNGFIWGNVASSSSCAVYNPSHTTGGPGITLQYAPTQNNTISGNYIGVGSDGVTALGNGEEGVNILGAENNIIGGTQAGTANIICNNRWGVLLDRDFGSGNDPSIGNQVIGNLIGVNKNGAAMGNGLKNTAEGGGVCLRLGATKNYIGMAVAGGGNTISGNRSGVVFQNEDDGSIGKGPAHDNFVYNNKIGTDAGGISAIPNKLAGGGADAGYGILIETGAGGTQLPYNNTIGGTGNLQMNVISGNDKDGISAVSKTSARAINSIVGNYIGVNNAGTGALSNGSNGINLIDVTGITIKSNIISANSSNGIRLDNADSTLIQSNKIGTDAIGATALKNTGDGINLSNGAAANIIGGHSTALGNLIAYNGSNGITVDGATSISNSIHENSFSCNAARGIVLSNGGNQSYPAPAITGTQVKMTITGSANSYIELYETDGCADCPKKSTSNKLQGKILLAAGRSPLTFPPVNGKVYTATASQDSTATPHNTSEFSICYSLCTPPDSVTVSAGDTTMFCQGGKVLLKPTISGGIDPFTYIWTNNGTVVKDSTKSTFTANASGTYAVQVFAGGGFCNTQSANTLTVTVYPTPDKPVITGSPAEFCAGKSGNLSATGSGTFKWFSGGAVVGSTNPLSVTKAGKYVVVVTSDKKCASPASDSTTVTVDPNPSKPVVSTNDPAIFCDGKSALLVASGTGNFQWYNNGVPVSKGDSLKVTTTGKYTVIATSDKNCSSPASDTSGITVNPTPSKPTIGANPAAFCEGKTGILTATVTGSTAGTFHWYVNGTTSSTNNPITVSLPGKYTVIVITDKNCSSPVSDTTLVTVNPNPAKPTVSSAGPQNFCDGLSDVLTATSATPGVTFQWYKNGNTLSSGVDLKATTAGKYTVIASTDKTCSSPASDTVTIIVYPIPDSPKISADQNSFCPGGNTDLKATYIGDGTIQWYKDNTTFGTSNPINVKAGGAYTVTIKSQQGCTSPASAPANITVLPPDPSASIDKAHNQICDTTFLLSASNPKGVWHVIGGSGKIDDPSINTTTIRYLSKGINVIVWDISAAPYTCLPVVLTDTLRLKVGLDQPILIDASGPNDTLCVTKPRQISIKVISGGSGDFTYIFNSTTFNLTSGDTSAQFFAKDEETFFTAQAIDNKYLGCKSDVDTFTVHSIAKQDLYIPNLLTPNDDNKNDKFVVYDQKKRLLDPDGSTLEIYNRWGHNVYKSNRYENTWTAEGLDDGVYYFHLKAGCGGNNYKDWVQVVSNLRDK